MDKGHRLTGYGKGPLATHSLKLKKKKESMIAFLC